MLSASFTVSSDQRCRSRPAARRLVHVCLLLALMAAVGLSACHIQPRQDRSQSAVQEPQGTGVPGSGDQSEAVDNATSVLPVLQLDLGGKEITQGSETDGTLSVIEQHDGSLTNLSAAPRSVQSRVTVEVQGDTSARLDKKSFRFELHDDMGEERDLALAGMPAGSDWVLHSCGSDRTCLRNVLVYALGREFGRYAPRTRFTELFVNGDYRGIYVLVERIRRGKNRVDVPRPSPTAAGDITGGYIFRMDLGEGHPSDPVLRDWVSPVTPTVYSYLYPRFNQITPEQKAYLQDHVRRFELMMRSDAWNQASGYRAWLDVPSWVDFALMQELAVNPDAYFKSVYLQKWPAARGNRIALGPFWDFDLAFGVADFRDARNTKAWMHRMNLFGAELVPYDPPRDVPYVPEYWERLWADPAFHRDLRCRWQELRQGPLELGRVHTMIDRWATQLTAAQPRDAALWGNPPANAYQGEVDMLKQFLGTRMAWMDTNLPGRCR
jgi:hypothetical protein